MLAALFESAETDDVVEAVADIGCSVPRFPWYAPEHAPVALDRQPGLFAAAAAAPLRFHSGSTAYWDLRGYVLAGAPVGITATALPRGAAARRVVDTVTAYASGGGHVFVDSGAFGAFVAGRALDFESDVFPVYEQLVASCAAPENLRLVMPDVVGDPEASMALQHRHADRLQRWMHAGVHCIFPLHSPTDSRFMRAIEHVAASLPFTIGVPSNLEAWSLPDLCRFCATHRPPRIHLLGLGDARTVQAFAEAVAAVSAGTEISCDSCSLLAHVGTGRRLTDRARTRLRDAVRWVMDDPKADMPFPALSTYVTQALWTPNFLAEEAVARIAAHFGIDATRALEAARSEGLLAVLGPLDPDEEWMEDELFRFVRREVYGPELVRVLRGPIRAMEVARLAGYALPSE